MRKYRYTINGNPYEVVIKKLNDDHAVVEVNGSEYDVGIIEEPRQRKTPQLIRSKPNYEAEKSPSKTKAVSQPAQAGVLKAPLPGLIMQVLVKEGDEVKPGQTVVKMEAMKMENNIQSNKAGKVISVKVKPGDSVLEGEALVEIGG